MKNIYAALVLVIFIGGCGSDEEVDAVSGVHFQGRDCLSCHNVDLQESSHLSVAGTVFKSGTSDKNDLNLACNEPVHMEFLIANIKQFSTEDINPSGAAGFNGRGNTFALLKDIVIPAGSYQIRLYNNAGDSISSTNDAHKFSATGFDINNPADENNVYSCNACHQVEALNAAPGLMFLPNCK